MIYTRKYYVYYLCYVYSTSAMLSIRDISAIYTHSHAMFDGGSPTLLSDYRRFLAALGIHVGQYLSIQFSYT